MNRSLSLLSLFLFVSAFFSIALMTSAQTFSSPVEMQGWAWSDNVGWISFNCSNDSSCATVDYAVEINPDYTMAGYAWNSNIGWIKFGGLSGFPTGGGNAQINTTLDSNELEGWARACSATADGTCDSLATLHPDGGGWDGWISLNCSNDNSCGVVDYGVSANNSGGFNSSFAWGSEVIGWVDFNLTTFTEPCPPTLSCSTDFSQVDGVDQWCTESVIASCDVANGQYCLPATYTCDYPNINLIAELTADKLFVREGGTVILDWEVDGTTAANCEVTDPDGNQVSTSLSGPANSTQIDRYITTFTLSCVPIGGGPLLELDTLDITQLGEVFET